MTTCDGYESLCALPCSPHSMLLSPFSFLLGLAVLVSLHHLGWLPWWVIVPLFEYFCLALHVFAPLGLCDDAVGVRHGMRGCDIARQPIWRGNGVG